MSTFLGREIGKVSRYTKGSTVEQYTQAQLETDVQTALEHCDVVVWSQFTPYFNDGDACVFSISGPWFFTLDDFDEDEFFDIVDYYPDDLSYENEGIMQENTNSWMHQRYPDKYPAPHPVLTELADRWQHYETISQHLFGDPTIIMVTKGSLRHKSFDHY